MAEQISRVDYFSLMIPNKPGQGACVLSPFTSAGVNFIGLWGYPRGAGKAQLDVVPEDAKAFAAAAKKAKIKIGKRQAGWFVKGEDRAGACAEVFGRLAAAKINVHAVQATSAGCGCYGMFLQFAPKDARKAAKALGV